MDGMTLYHITDKEVLPDIMRDGIKPMIGKNSKSVNEDVPAIYVCTRGSVGYWKAILGKKVVLKIEGIKLTKEDEKHDYGFYGEYVLHKKIPASHVKQVYLYTSDEQMKKLCLSYIDTISYITCIFMRQCYGRHNKYSYVEYLNNTVPVVIDILNRLDFHVVEKKDIRCHLRNVGENGGYTLCDRFMDEEDTRLWQKLESLSDEVAVSGGQLYSWIKDNLKGCLKVNTGGWTG